MMLLQSLFISVINLSFGASFLMLALLLLRPILKKLPKWMICAMWTLVAVRLMIPFTLESRWSLIPDWSISIASEKGVDAENGISFGKVSTGGKESKDKDTAAISETQGELLGNPENHGVTPGNYAGGQGNSADVPGHYAGDQGNSADVPGNYAGDQGYYAGMQGNPAETQGNYAGMQGNPSGTKGNIAGEQGNSGGSQGNPAVPQENYVGAQGNPAVSQENYVGAQGNPAGTQGNSAGDQENYAGTQGNSVGVQGSSAGAQKTIVGEMDEIPGDPVGAQAKGMLVYFGSGIWIAGVIVMLAYEALSAWRLWRTVRLGVRKKVGGVEIWTGGGIDNSFLFGIFRPRIYLPEGLEEQHRDYVLRHELAHLKRRDYLWKPLGYLILSVYWFHPLCWVSYLLFCRDMEMACDEKVTKEFDANERARYCQTILDLSYGKRNALIGTANFGQSDTKSRVEAVLSHKKPAKWVKFAGMMICLALGAFFLTSPNGKAIGNLLSFPTKIQRTDKIYDAEGNERDITFDLLMRSGKDGINLSGSILFDGRTYLDAKNAMKNPEGDWSNFFFIPQDYAINEWKEFIAINPLDGNMDSYTLFITAAGETKTYSSEKAAISSKATEGNQDHPGKGEDAPSGNQDKSAGGKEESAGSKEGSSAAANLGLSGKAAWESEGIDISDFYAKDNGDILNAYVIDEGGVLWGYGENRFGQLGQGFADRKFYKEKVKMAEHAIHVDYSQSGFMIYLTEDHKLYGLGNGGSGVLLTGENIDWSSLVKGEEHAVCSPVLLMEHVQYACCGRNDIVCLLEDGSVWTWGITGISTARDYQLVSEPVKILDGAILVTGGMFNHAALLSDGGVWTWGYNYAGGCGVPELGIVDTPTKVADNVIRVWTSRKRTNTCADYENMSPENEKHEETTIIERADHSFWRCGEGVGNEEKLLKKYYEAVDFPIVCTHEFLPCTPRNFDGTEVTAKDAFKRFLSGDRTVLNPEQERRGGFAGYLTGLDFGFSFEYVLMDLDGDGSEELIVQSGDDLGDYNGVFHFENVSGRVVSWRDDAFESDRVYLLSDGSLAKRWTDYVAQREYWIIFRYLPGGEEEEIKRFVHGDPSAYRIEAGLEEHDYPWNEIDGVEVTSEEFQREYERSIYNKRVTSWRNAATGEIREAPEGTGVPAWCFGIVHFENNWIAKLEDFDGNGEEEYLTVEASPVLSGSGSILTVYWNKKAVCQYEDALNIIKVSNYHYSDLDNDGERELFLELLPNVNSMPLVQYLVLKEGRDGWYALENFETVGESLTNSFPLRITYSDKPWEAKITCDGYDGEILVDVKRVYDAWEEDIREAYGEGYEKAFGKGNNRGECAQIADWGIWEIGFRRFEGENCLVARQGIVRDWKDALWGVVDIIFNYDRAGKICVKDMRFEYVDEYYGAMTMPYDTVMSDMEVQAGAYAEENVEGLLPAVKERLETKEYYYIQIDQSSSYSFRYRVCVHDLVADEDRAVTEWQRAYFWKENMAISRFDGHEATFRFLKDQTDSVPERMTVSGLEDYGVFSILSL